VPSAQASSADEHVDFGKLEAERVSVRAEIDRRAALVEVKA